MNFTFSIILLSYVEQKNFYQIAYFMLPGVEVFGQFYHSMLVGKDLRIFFSPFLMLNLKKRKEQITFAKWSF
jgi:hypothetical protein